MGQTATSVNAYHMIGMGTIDETIARLLEQKTNVIDAVTDGVEGDGMSMFDELVKSLAEKDV